MQVRALNVFIKTGTKSVTVKGGGRLVVNCKMPAIKTTDLIQTLAFITTYTKSRLELLTVDPKV